MSLLFCKKADVIPKPKEIVQTNTKKEIIFVAGEKIVVSYGYDIKTKVDSINVISKKFKAKVKPYCGKGIKILNDEKSYKCIKKDEIRKIFTNFLKKAEEPTAFNFYQGANSFYINVYDDKTIKEFCNKKNESNVICNAIVLQIYSGNKKYNIHYY